MGRHTVQQRETSCKTNLGKANTPSNKRKQEGRQWETRGDKNVGKADTPSNKGKQEWGHAGRKGETGRQWETRGDKTPGKADTPSNKREIRRGTMRDKRRQDPREGGHTIQQRESRRGIPLETRGDKTLEKADTPSNKGNQEGAYHHTHHLGLCGGNGNTSSK